MPRCIRCGASKFHRLLLGVVQEDSDARRGQRGGHFLEGRGEPCIRDRIGRLAHVEYDQVGFASKEFLEDEAPGDLFPPGTAEIAHADQETIIVPVHTGGNPKIIVSG